MNALLICAGWPIGNAETRSDKNGHKLAGPMLRRRARAATAAAGMIKRIVAPTIVLCACLVLASCSSFAGFVSDHWPTWAGGMPKDVPPRPGEPGYQAFIAHDQGGQGAASPNATAPGVTPAVATALGGAAAAPAAGNVNMRAMPLDQRAVPPGNRQTNDQAAAPGGLY